MTQSRLAPAKINLALHVTGRRADGCHLLDSLVVFAGTGDWLHVTPAQDVSLQVLGPRAAGVPTGPENLVLRAATLFDSQRGVRICLEKHLPHAAGIGGGSVNAAAALLSLAELWNLPLPKSERILALGADVPVCMAGRPTRMRGIGEVLAKVPALPTIWLVLANPGVAMPTAPVFRGMKTVDGSGLIPPAWKGFDDFVAWLSTQRNDLEAPARALAPGIDIALAAISDQPYCALARMSGSGATCFGVFASEPAACRAATAIRAAYPRWWVTATPVL
ncbi:MAG: 4-(cytidine 5'-diphospho)-2-C-methyl-D-erythritol kinase [Rhodobacteraceae bacterium]|nr:4-(cytidine 5'-diphospho)-2-C-methyl-D-erythritol kinase [Paracoccaceae bacterium]